MQTLRGYWSKVSLKRIEGWPCGRSEDGWGGGQEAIVVFNIGRPAWRLWIKAGDQLIAKLSRGSEGRCGLLGQLGGIVGVGGHGGEAMWRSGQVGMVGPMRLPQPLG